jgi:hypothetical protein
MFPFLNMRGAIKVLECQQLMILSEVVRVSIPQTRPMPFNKYTF